MNVNQLLFLDGLKPSVLQNLYFPTHCAYKYFKRKSEFLFGELYLLNYSRLINVLSKASQVCQLKIPEEITYYLNLGPGKIFNSTT